MKRLLWLGLLFTSVSWLYFIPIFAPQEWMIGVVFLLVGLCINILGLRDKEIRNGDKKYLVLVLPLLVPLLFLEFPYSTGLIVLLIGFVFYAIPIYYPRRGKLNQIWPGLFFSGVLLSVQAFILPLYLKFASRIHGSDLLTSLTSFIGNIFGLNINSSGETLFIGAIDSNPAIILSWESLSLYLWIHILIGTLLMFLFIGRKKKIGINLVKFLIISIFYLIVRFLFLIFILVETLETEEITFLVGLLDILFDPLVQFIMAIPFILLLIKFITLKEINIDFHWFRKFNITKKQLIASFLVFIFAFSSVAVVGFQDPGRKKEGKILIDEYHSDWEDSIIALDKDWYGRLSTYNFYSLAEWLKHYYAIDQNENETLTSDMLNQYDILILKCPTNPFSDEEVDSIDKFVRNGGGLYAIGDHTNVFGMNSYLNKVTRRFGIEFNTDATHEYSAPGGFSKFTPSKILPHPIVQFVSEFQFLTSDTLDASITAEEVIAGDKLTTFPGTYATPAFFVEDKMLEQTRGVFLQTVALKYGKGRVIAFSDSTVFSSYSIFLSGYQPFNLGALEYLNRENIYDYLNTVFFIVALICFGAVIFLLRKEKKAKALFVSVIIGAASVSIAATTFTQLNKGFYPLPKPVIQIDKRVCFDEEHSNAVITPVPSFAWGDKLNRDQKQRYLTFYVWTQRVGCTPSLNDNLESAIDNSDLIVIINPDTSFSNEEISSLKECIMNGGRLLLMDSIYNFNTTANELLANFNLGITTIDSLQPANIIDANSKGFFESVENLPVGNTIAPILTINGGTKILTSEEGQTILAFATYGNGIVAVFVDSVTFSDAIMGGVFSEPDEELREIYDMEYYLFESLLYDEDDVDSAALNGYVYEDVNDNNVYELAVDKMLANATVTVSKIDNFNPGLSETYKTSDIQLTDETGYFNITHMMPGYYSLEVIINKMLISQHKILLSSGVTTTYNISKATSGSFEGVTYYDANLNYIYDLGEELSDVNVEMLHLQTNGERLVIDTVISNATGVYSFSSLPPGEYVINATKKNSTTGNFDYVIERGYVIMENKQVIFNISLNLAPVIFNGTITYDNDTKENMYIYFFANGSIENNTALSLMSVISNSSGYFELQLYPGYYNISINQTVNENGEDIQYFFSDSLKIDIGSNKVSFNIMLKKD